MTLAGFNEANGPLCTAGETVEPKFTVDVNPFTLIIEIVGVADDPRFRVMLKADDVMLKSPTLTVTMTEWESVPLEPVIVTIDLAAAVALKVQAEVPVPPEGTGTFIGEHEAVTVAGEADVDSMTIPANPFWLLRLIVDIADESAGNATALGLAAIEKSGVFVGLKFAAWRFSGSLAPPEPLARVTQALSLLVLVQPV